MMQGAGWRAPRSAERVTPVSAAAPRPVIVVPDPFAPAASAASSVDPAASKWRKPRKGQAAVSFPTTPPATALVPQFLPPRAVAPPVVERTEEPPVSLGEWVGGAE